MIALMITGLNHVTFAVRDLDESFDFYCSVLGLRPVFRWSEGVYLLAGDFWIALIEDSERRPGPLPDYSHVAFSVQASNFEGMSQKIRTSGATIWQKNTSEGDSLYFLDPNGHKLEIHSSDLVSRLRHKQAHYSADMQFFGAGPEGGSNA